MERAYPRRPSLDDGGTVGARRGPRADAVVGPARRVIETRYLCGFCGSSWLLTQWMLLVGDGVAADPQPLRMAASARLATARRRMLGRITIPYSKVGCGC